MNGANTGKLGELATARLLREKGCEILAANYRCRLGEIDIIASDKLYICFVEVKTRSEDSTGLPSDAVTPAKRRRLLAAAKLYLSQNGTRLQPRFDVAEVYMKDGAVQNIRYIPNAFNGEGR